MPALPDRQRAFMALLLVAVVACFPEGVTPGGNAAVKFAAKTAPVSVDTVGTPAAPLPSVVVTGKNGRPNAGVPVTFSVAMGGGTLVGASQTTDVHGVATVGGWMLGPTVGAQKIVSKAVPGTVEFVVDARPAPAGALAKVNDGQNGTVGVALAQPVGVLVKDIFGNPLAGASVTFAAGNGSSVPSATVVSNAAGEALTQWTMGTAAGPTSMTATVSNVAPATFVANASAGPAFSVVAASTPSNGVVGQPVAEPVTVVIRDSYGNPVSAAVVAFAGANGSSALPASVNTDASGLASTRWTLGTVAGSMSLTATVGALQPVGFSVVAHPGPAAQVTKVGDGQQGVVGELVANPVGLVVKDSYGNLVPNAAVSFTPGNGSLVGAPVVNTDASGTATTSWTMGTVAGRMDVSVAVGTVAPVIISATAAAGAPAKLSKQANSDNQVGAPGATLSQPIGVVVRDKYDNALLNVTVNYAPQNGGSANPPAALTTAQGLANSMWTLGAASGTQTMTATVGALAPLTFTATAVAADPCSLRGTLGFPASVSGNNSASQCLYNNGYARIDNWGLNLTSSTPMEIVQESTDPNMDSYLALYRNSYTDQQHKIGYNDDGFDLGVDSRIRFLGGVGSFVIGATHFSQVGGPYTLSTRAWSGALDKCQQVFAVFGTSTNQVLDSGDCPVRNDRFNDVVEIYLRNGESMRVTMRSTAFDAKLEIETLVAGRFSVVASDDNSGGGTDAQVTVTATKNDFYRIILTSSSPRVGGGYSLAIANANAGASPSVAGGSAVAPMGEATRQVNDSFRRRTKAGGLSTGTSTRKQ